jgi:hypothetical protein
MQWTVVADTQTYLCNLELFADHLLGECGFHDHPSKLFANVAALDALEYVFVQVILLGL